MTVINANGKILDLTRPKVMGILNVTPDSFFDGNKYNVIDKALQRVDTMIEEGMDILDIGAASSRPKATEIPIKEEIERLIPVLKAIRNRHSDLLISVDTYREEVMTEAMHHDINFLNDITGGRDPKLTALLSSTNVAYILMHMQNSPFDMQEAPNYQNVTLDVFQILKNKIRSLKKQGLKDIIIDLGFGFGKTISHNYQLLNDLNVFRILECPILVGLSRKSMIHRPLDIKAEHALNGTTALHMVALENGANLLRVHDVKEAKECIRLFDLLKKHK